MDYFVKDRTDDLLEAKYYDIRGGHKVYVRVSRTPTNRAEGDPYFKRTPVILVPGLVVAGTYMIPLAEALAPWLPVYIVDFPGYGCSYSKDGEILSFDQIVDSLVAFLDAAVLPRASFVGNSFGCQIIASLAARYPTRVDRCILQGPTIDKNKRSLWKQIPLWLLNGAKEGAPSMTPIMVIDYYKAGWWRIKETIRMSFNDKIEENVRKIRCPTLIVTGDKDPVATPQWGQQLADIAPHAKQVILLNCTHTANYAAPKRFARVARPFLMAPSAFSLEKHEFDYSKVKEMFDLPEPTPNETVELELPNIADFDSASGMLRASSGMLHGMEFNHLGVYPPLLPTIMPLFNYLPETIRNVIYANVGAMEATKPKKLVSQTGSVQIAHQIVEHFPKGIKYPAVAIGSSNGALTHAYTAMGIPWLPQTLLIPVRRHNHDAYVDGILDMTKEMEWGKDAAAEFLAANPDLQLHHMADPNQDQLMIKYMAYFRFKYSRLPKDYKRFIKNTLEPDGTILISECDLKWKLKKVNSQYYFQAGAFGGLEPDDYIYGNEEVREVLRTQSRHTVDNPSWNAPKTSLVEGPEAEWGFVTSMREDLMKFASKHGYAIKQISFNCPDHPSPLIAELYRSWYAQIGFPTDHLIMSSFIFMEPFHTIRMGLIPYWTAFSVEKCAKDIEKYLRHQKERGTPYTDAHAMLFSHGANSIGIAKLDRWRSILQSSETLSDPVTNDDVFVGVTTRCFPKDFACVVNYNPEMKRRFSERFTMPPPMKFEFFDEFVEKNCYLYNVQYTNLAGRSAM